MRRPQQAERVTVRLSRIPFYNLTTYFTAFQRPRIAIRETMNNFIENVKWRRSTGLIFWGTTIQSVFGFLGLLLLLYLIYDFSGIMLRGIMPSLAYLNLAYYENTFYGFFGGILICSLISFLGYIVYLIGICLFKGAQQSPYMELKAKTVMLVDLIIPGLLILLNILLYKCPEIFIVDFKTMIMWVLLCWIGSLVAVIVLLIQFKAFSKSDVWSEKACQGASDVRFSYTCILWMQLILIVGCGLIALTIISQIDQLTSIFTSSYGSYGMYEAAQGINSATKFVDDLVTGIRIWILVIGFLLVIFGGLQTVYRIMGWRKIQLGGEKEVRDLDSESEGSNPTSDHVSYCHKCGTRLPQGSAFCPKCGSQVIATSETNEINQIAGNSSEELTGSSETAIGYEETYEEEKDLRKKWMLWGGIAAVVVAIIVVAIICLRPEKMESNARVLANHTVVFKSVEDGVGIEPIENLQYGTAVESKDSEFDKEGIWTKVAIEKDGKIATGYMAKSDLISPEDYYLLDKGGMSDKGTREIIPSNIQRVALLDALKRSEGNWSLDFVNIAGDRMPNIVRLVVRGVNPSEDCIGFILDNDERNGERKFFLYSTPDIYNPNAEGAPVYLYSEPVRNGVEAIHDVTYRKKKYNVSYINSPTNTSFNYEEYEDYVEEQEAETTKEKQLGGNVEMAGYIDDKYAVKMQFTEYPDGSISGDYMYVKNNVPITLKGKYTDRGDYHDITLEETVNGNLTGKFTGYYDGLTFSGSWISTDETRKMPFKLSR